MEVALYVSSFPGHAVTLSDHIGHFVVHQGLGHQLCRLIVMPRPFPMILRAATNDIAMFAIA